MTTANWPKVKLGKVCEFKYGKSLPKAKRDGGELDVYGSNGIVGNHSEAITDGETIVIGRKGSFGEVNYSTNSCWPIDTAYFVDKSATEHHLRWLGYRLASLGLTNLNKLAAVPGLNRDDAYRQTLLLPPLEEQKRIAEVLDRAEALRARRRAALALLDELTQSIFLDMFGDPLANPMDWKKVKLKEVLELITYGLTVRPKYIPEGIPLISGKEIRDGEIDFDRASKMSEADFESLSDKAKPRLDDVLFSKTGSIGHTALVDEARTFALAQNVARLTFDPAKVDKVFALHYLRSTSVQHLAQRSVRGNAVKDLQLGVMGDFPCVLPPLKLQLRFSERMAALEKLKTSHSIALEQCDALFSSLQSRAFKGELFDCSREPVAAGAD